MDRSVRDAGRPIRENVSVYCASGASTTEAARKSMGILERF